MLVVEINEDHPKEKKAIYSELVMAREAVINMCTARDPNAGRE